MRDDLTTEPTNLRSSSGPMCRIASAGSSGNRTQNDRRNEIIVLITAAIVSEPVNVQEGSAAEQ